MNFTIAQERSDNPESRQLISELDEYLNSLYPPENNYILGVEDLLKSNVTFVIARIDSKAAGCGALRIMEGYGEIKRMYVRPNYRGRGLGQKILEHLCAIASELGLTSVKLETGKLQVDARKLYESAGFRPTERFGEYEINGVSLFYERKI